MANLYTMGGASASGTLLIAKKSIRNFAKKLGAKAIKALIRGTKTSLKKGKAYFKKKATELSLKALSKVMTTGQNRVVTLICSKLHEKWLK